MPYTLVKGLAWVVMALLMGGVIGWLLRSLTSRRQIARARSVAATQAVPAVPAAPSAPGPTGVQPAATAAPPTADALELERLRIRLAELEPVVVERDRLRAQLDQPSPDAVAAASVLGREVTVDDLGVVVGISPAIAALCHRIGIRTWWDLATTETSLLRTMLSDAGPGFAANDPSTWPAQARLLAEGRWAEFAALAATLRPGPDA